MYTTLLANIQHEFPTFKLMRKEDSWLMRAISRLLLIITFGQLKNFMSDFTTTIGYTIYTPTVWNTLSERSRCVTLAHERIHMRQRQRYGWWYNILYLFVPLPIGLAYYRFKFEREAYEENLKAIVEAQGPLSLYNKDRRESFISIFTGANYCWTWLRRSDVEAWYDKEADRISVSRLERTKDQIN